MPILVQPTPVVRSSFRCAMGEFRAEGRGGPDDDSMIGSELRRFGPTWSELDGFSAYTAALRADADEDTPRADGRVPCTTWWWIEGAEYLGRIAVRHRLTEHLWELGGHIGYDVRPTARRQGHATAMLAAVLPLAHDLGVDPALLTSDVDNVASRRVIEINGGRLEDERHGTYRFWLPTTH